MVGVFVVDSFEFCQYIFCFIGSVRAGGEGEP